MKNKDKIVDEIFMLYETYGRADYIGEPVSQIEHMSQAAKLAIDEGYDDEVVLAAFFHDVGHICMMYHADSSMGSLGMKNHEKIGAVYLREKGFSERIVRLVENHVQAKRYLTFISPDYYRNLSEASKKTLELQGGKMSREQADHFEKDPLFDISIRMRHWDEQAKETNMPLIDLGKLKSKVKAALS
jgi:phosphonate degradation associated HDIG domain protein